VLAIATFVALGCNLLATTFINRQSKPFCDSGDLDSPDAISGEFPHFFNFLVVFVVVVVKLDKI